MKRTLREMKKQAQNQKKEMLLIRMMTHLVKQITE